MSLWLAVQNEMSRWIKNAIISFNNREMDRNGWYLRFEHPIFNLLPALRAKFNLGWPRPFWTLQSGRIMFTLIFYQHNDNNNNNNNDLSDSGHRVACYVILSSPPKNRAILLRKPQSWPVTILNFARNLVPDSRTLRKKDSSYVLFLNNTITVAHYWVTALKISLS